MSDQKNPNCEVEESSPADGSAREGRGELPRSYYYDDATGYEIYKDEDDADLEEPADEGRDGSEI